MSKYHNDNSAASDPLAINLSEPKLRRLQPELYDSDPQSAKIQWGKRQLAGPEIRAMIAEHMRCGDTRAAVVVSEKPLIVAAYTDEQDAVLLLQFPPYLMAEHQLRVGSKLLTVNTYGAGSRVLDDIVEGPASTGQYANFYPIIAEFVSDNDHLINSRKQSISPAEWKRAFQFGMAALAQAERRVRDGRPLFSQRPEKPGRPSGKRVILARKARPTANPLLDKLASVVFGAPALAGTIGIILATGSRGSAPFRQRHIYIPAGIVLILFGVIGGLAYSRWRSRS